MQTLEFGLFKPKQIKLRISILSCLLILSFPKAILAAQPLPDDFKTSVSLQPFADLEKEKYNLKVIQPYRFDQNTLLKTLSSLAYQKRGISWSSKRRVFNAQVTSRLLPMILEQFTLADPDQRIVFRVKNEKGKSILAGDTFLTTAGLHWRMTAIQKIKRKVDDFSVSGDPWRLVPLTHQSYQTKENIKDLVQDITNWIVFKKIKPDSDRIIKLSPVSEKTKIPSALQKRDIKTRLKILEDLRREGLVREKEYKIKRQKILDDL